MNVSNRKYPTGRALSELTTYQVGAIESAAHRALRQHKDELLKTYDMTGMDWYIVGAVSDAGEAGIRLTDLAEMLGTTMGFVTKAIKLLEAKNILYRKANAKDARSSYIALNANYHDTVEEIETALRAKLRESIYGHVTPEELLTYIQVMEKFSKLKD